MREAIKTSGKKANMSLASSLDEFNMSTQGRVSSNKILTRLYSDKLLVSGGPVGGKMVAGTLLGKGAEVTVADAETTSVGDDEKSKLVEVS